MKLQPDIIYHENSNFLLFPESERHIEILGADLPINRSIYYLDNINITPFNGGNGRYREFLFHKI